MKVFDLQCGQHHVFEGWFASEDDFLNQLDRGLLTCPVCGDQQVHKMLSAPRLNLRGGQAPSPLAPAGQTGTALPSVESADSPQLQQARLLRAMRQLMADTEDVGERFAQQALAMHHGEIERRQIRGQASVEEAVTLLEEGVDIVPLPVLPALKETLQ